MAYIPDNVPGAWQASTPMQPNQLGLGFINSLPPLTSNANDWSDTPTNLPIDMDELDTMRSTTNRRRTRDDNEHQESDFKRVAVPGPSQAAFDELREREECARREALERTEQLRAQTYELQLMRNELVILRREGAEVLRKLESDQETEAQMADQILQSEKKIMDLTAVNTQLATMLENSRRQFEEQQKLNNEMLHTIQSMRDEHERDKENRASEILVMRQRLESLSATSTAPQQSPLGPHPSSSPAAIRPRNRTNFLRGEVASIGVVPLRPVAPSTTTEPGPEINSNAAAGEHHQDSSGHSTLALNTNNPQMVETVQTVVRETLRQMNITEITIPKNGRKKCSTRTMGRNALERQKKQITKEADLAWKETVRQAWKIYFNVKSVADFAEYEPASVQSVEEYETGSNGPDDRKLLDFSKGYDKSRWNRSILHKLHDEILEERAREGTWGLPDVSGDYLIALLYGQLKRSREAWKLVQKRPNYNSGRLETSEEISERVDEYMEERLATVSLRSRRERKYERRQKTVEKVITIKTESDAPDLAAWLYFRALLETLTVDGMSEEEEGVEKLGDLHVPVFRVKLCVWRNPAVSDYFKYIDKESQNQAIRGKRGSKLHPRIQTNDVSTGVPPKDLPRSLYHAGWLAHQEEFKGREWVETELRVSKEVFDLLEFSAQDMQL